MLQKWSLVLPQRAKHRSNGARRRTSSRRGATDRTAMEVAETEPVTAELESGQIRLPGQLCYCRQSGLCRCPGPQPPCAGTGGGRLTATVAIVGTAVYSLGR